MIASEAVLERLRHVFSAILDNPDFVFSCDAKLGQSEGWDSFAQINLIIEIESTFNVEFDSDQISELTSVELILNALLSKLNDSSERH